MWLPLRKLGIFDALDGMKIEFRCSRKGRVLLRGDSDDIYMLLDHACEHVREHSNGPVFAEGAVFKGDE